MGKGQRSCIRTRAVQLLVLSALPLSWLGCRKTDSLQQAIATARPELRQAINAICTPTKLGDNYDDELQVAWRLHILTDELRFKPQPPDRPLLKALATNETQSCYSRICAAYFLWDSDSEARAVEARFLGSTNLRQRFNAARALQWYSYRAKGDARDWTLLNLIRLVENHSLEVQLPLGEYRPSPGSEAQGFDLWDESLSPLDKVIQALGDLKDIRAIPILEKYIEADTNAYRAEGAIQALRHLGDPSAAPFLMKVLENKPQTLSDVAGAFAGMKYSPGAPLVAARLGQCTNSYEGLRTLEFLLALGNLAALPDMEKYVESLPDTDHEARTKADPILKLMRAKDPVAALLTMLENHPGEFERLDLIRYLGRYDDPRAIEQLFLTATCSDNTLFRRNAIWALSSANNRNSLLALVSVMETNAPPPSQFDKYGILDGRPADYSKREAERLLRYTTPEDFGVDAEAWRRWIRENR